ncbi:MAG: hypothetical protein K8F36_01140 [Melioribacteraceae bacterium]|nr:hypothetical protein [Melioribacteraceae bacterium]MCO6472949.1 hypothetical protein [Melioribacteraceae bacterium]MDD3559026.1 thiamine pyrophosphate-dependent enzyme [Melioribacteraceae bacterium]
MKVKVSQAAAYALKDLGVEVITNVPGFGGSETMTEINQIFGKNFPVSFNEEVSYTIAHGASIAGKRSCSIMKSQGFAKAANSILDSLYTDLTAGFMILIFDDPDGSHSDNIIEIDPILKGFKIPFLRSTGTNIYDDILKAYEESEKRKLPFVIIFNAMLIDSPSNFERKENSRKSFEYKRSVLDHVVHPFLAEYQFRKFIAKTLQGDLTSLIKPNLPNVPLDLPERYKINAQKYEPLFQVFRDLRGDVVSGDTSTSSVYVFPPYSCIDIVTYIGGSIPLAIGAYLAGNKDVWALTGDFGFIAAGHMGLIELLQREIPVKVLIFNNKQASATGGQTIPKKIMMRLLAGYENFLLHISNPTDVFEVNQVLTEAKKSDTFKIIVADF